MVFYFRIGFVLHLQKYDELVVRQWLVMKMSLDATKHI